MTIPEIIETLTRHTGKFPKAAVEEAMSRKEEITPHLLDALEEMAKEPKQFDRDDYMLHLYAPYLPLS
jgi:hypothetical protein